MLTGLGAFVPVLLLGAVSAAPAPENSLGSSHGLFRRQAVYDSGCDRDNPFVKGEKYKVKAQKAFADLAELSNTVLNVGPIEADGKKISYKDSDAFKHYFADADYNKVMQMHQTIYNDRLPADDRHSTSYKYTVKCGSDQNRDACKDAIAATSFDPKVPLMILCDQFFDPKIEQTNKNLDSKVWGTKRGQWCQPDVKLPFFFVAGESLYHEITHLDEVGKQAGLPERDEGNPRVKSHGTDDVYALSDKNKYRRGTVPMLAYDASRQLKIYWDEYNKDHSKYKPQLATIQNAESYAASALEYYVQYKCHWPTIKGES